MILHIDMDAFYASIEIRDRPELKGQPVIVGGTPEGRGVVAAASYEARRFGVHSALPASRAMRLCPQAVVIPPRLEYYTEISRQIQEIFHRFTPLVEPLSLDEAFLDVTGSESLFGSSREIGWQIKKEVHEAVHLVASVGIAPNKFLAKVASDLEKPDGFVIVPPDRIQPFLDPLPISRVWGVGKVTEKTFAKLGVKTIRDLCKLPQENIAQHLGEQGVHLWKLAHGIDDRRVVPDREAKSVSHETTFAEDIKDIEVLRSWAIELTDQVARRMRQHQRCGRTVHLKVRFSDFQTITRSTTLPRPTDITREIWLAVNEMLSTRLPENHRAVRLLGVGVSGFGAPSQGQQRTLFDSDHDAQSNLDQAADQIRDKYGSTSIGRASSLLHDVQHSPPPKVTDMKPEDL